MKELHETPGGAPPEGGRPAGLSPLAAWSLAFGCAVGWGSFVMPGTTFLPKAGPLGTVLGVLAGGLVMAVIAWNYHRMMERSPGPGGAYAYAKEAFGIDHGFLCAWFLVLTYVAIVWANATALAIVARYTLGDVFRFGFRYSLAGFEVCLGDILVSGAAIAAATALCCRRWLACAADSILAVGFALGIALCFAAVALGQHRWGHGLAEAGPAFAPGGPNPLFQTLKIVALSPWLFVGFESISHASGEFRFPARRSFGIMALALVASVLAYALLAALPALGGAGDWPAYLERLRESTGGMPLPTFEAVKRVLGGPGVALMGATMFGAIFTGLVGNTFAASRLMAAMADDGILPAWYGRRGADGSPTRSVLAIGAVSALVPLLGRTAIGFIVDVSTVGAAIAYAYVSAATWRLAGAKERAARLAGACGVALSVAVLLLFIVPNYVSGSMMATESYLLLVLWCILGFLFFRSVFRRDALGRFGKSTVVWIAILVLITAMSLLWMRQSTGDSTLRTFDKVVRMHDTVLPHANEEEERRWVADVQALRSRLNATLLRDGLIQTGLMGLAFAILFNLHSILRKRERELVDENAQRQRERDMEREKARARSYFFSTVSHDIRTPLNAIIGYSEMLKSGFESEEERKKAVDSIIVSGKTLLGLVNDVLDLSKLESGKMHISPEPTDCAALLEKIVDSFHAAGDRPEMELRLRAQEMPRLMLDPQRLRQIVFNLVGNAMKFTEHGHVEVRASFSPPSGDAGEDGDPAGTFRLEVEDTGCGISPENLKRIASPYVQVGSKVSRHGGTGLGLAICKQLAAAMGGELTVASELGVGSTFSVTVPARRAPESDAAEGAGKAGRSGHDDGVVFGGGSAGDASAAPRGKVSRILVVDDSKMNLSVTKALLGRIGDYEVETALDGDLALERLRTPGAPAIDLVLTDMWMARMDGEALVRAIRADPALAPLKVFAVTADVEFREKARDAGFDGMLLKPVTMVALRSMLK